MAIIPKFLMERLYYVLKDNSSENTSLTIFKPKKIIKEKKEELSYFQKLVFKLQNKMNSKCINNDLEFLNLCQSKYLDLKILGYFGSFQFISNDIKFMNINTLKKDIIDCFNKNTSRKHCILRKIPIYTKIAIMNIINYNFFDDSSDDLMDLNEMKNEIQFVCDPVYLILFYKLYGIELVDVFENDESIEETNSDLKEKIDDEKIPLIEQTIADLFKSRGYSYLFGTSQKEIKRENINYEAYTREYFSLKLTATSIINKTFLIKLQLLLEYSNYINLSRREILFLFTCFQETTCFIVKTKIIEILTAIKNTKKDDNWNKTILGQLKYPGLFILPFDRLALLFACLKYLIVHDLFVGDVNLFLYRLLHATNLNIVSNALQLLRLRKISKKQVIDRCLQIDKIDDLSTKTVLDYITEKTCIFTFKRIKDLNLLNSDCEKIEKILEKVFSICNDKLRRSVIKKYPFLADKFQIVNEIIDEKILFEIRDEFIKNLDEYKIGIICDIIHRNYGFKGNESQKYYKNFYKKSISIIESSENLKKNEIICYLITTGMKYGDIKMNKRIFEEAYLKSKCEVFRGVFKENLEFFDLLE